MFASEAGTFIRALPGEGATLRSLLIKDAVGSFPNGATKPEILTCDVDVFICLKESEETALFSYRTKPNAALHHWRWLWAEM